MSEYKKNAKYRNIEWHLDDEYALKLFESKCSYCNVLIAYNGIDRIDSSKFYTTDNCISCCKICNIILPPSYECDHIVPHSISKNDRHI